MTENSKLMHSFTTSIAKSNMHGCQQLRYLLKCHLRYKLERYIVNCRNLKHPLNRLYAEF
jgi:hypothetical protein